MILVEKFIATIFLIRKLVKLLRKEESLPCFGEHSGQYLLG
jgi:hypothetical protein